MKKSLVWIALLIALLYFAYNYEYGRMLLITFGAVSSDLFSQMWRFRMFHKFGTSKFFQIIVGGFLLRIGVILIFTRVGYLWLSRQYFNFYLYSLVLVPILNIYYAVHFKQGS